MKHSWAGGGAGGGAVRIESTGTVVVDGWIIADGANALRYSGGGSGGGIWISCRQFGGTGGLIRANGGARGDEGGGGGGGRIAVDYTSLTGTPMVRFETREAPCTLPRGHVAARWPTHWLSGHGTLWFPDSQLVSATLDRFDGMLLLADATGWPPDSLTVSNGLVELAGDSFEIDGALTVGRDGVLVLAPDGPVRVGGEVLVDGGRLVLNDFTQMVCQAGLTVTNGGVFHACAAPTNGTVAFGASVDVTGEIRVAADSWIIPDCQGTNGGPVRLRCTRARIAANGGIDATGRGFLGGDMIASQKGLGPGGGTGGAIGSYGAGGGYGGQGGWSWYEPYGWGKAGGPAYGSSLAPVMPGSGGGSFQGYTAGHGGGTVWLEADDTIVLDGAVLADASTPLSYAGGGAGGGVFLAARDFGGKAGGRISAGGTPGGDRAGPGGGGRIAVAIGLDAGAVQTLLDNEPLPELFTYSRHGRYSGSLHVAEGAPGPDYTGETWRAPQPGTALFLTTNTTFHITGSPGEYGHPVPDPYGGCPYYAPGAWITNGVATPDDEAAGTRHACLGWTLHDASETLLTSGASTQAVFRLDATRVLTWQWTNEYHLAIHEGLDGRVTTGLSGWYTHATVVAGI
ncbi:MAG: hypothetical protein GX590_00705, partial [Lentisphaerae bacterium]|nr:hypothetical protein [Lentisphaerota bacterium]